MCVVGLRYFVARASTTSLIRLRLNVILLCEAYFRCREQIKKPALGVGKSLEYWELPG